MNCDQDDEPPPYPGVLRRNDREIYRCNSLPLRRTSVDPNVSSNRFFSRVPEVDMNLTRHCPVTGQFRNAIELETRIWISNDRASLVCYTGRLPEEFLRIAPSPQKELNFIIEYESIPMLNEASSKISMPKKSLMIMNWPTFRVLKKPKVRSKILENVLERVDAGETIRTQMVPQELIIDRADYSYDQLQNNLGPRYWNRNDFKYLSSI